MTLSDHCAFTEKVWDSKQKALSGKSLSTGQSFLFNFKPGYVSLFGRVKVLPGIPA
jgi:hypothetical protein